MNAVALGWIAIGIFLGLTFLVTLLTYDLGDWLQRRAERRAAKGSSPRRR